MHSVTSLVMWRSVKPLETRKSRIPALAIFCFSLSPLTACQYQLFQNNKHDVATREGPCPRFTMPVSLQLLQRFSFFRERSGGFSEGFNHEFTRHWLRLSLSTSRLRTTVKSVVILYSPSSASCPSPFFLSSSSFSRPSKENDGHQGLGIP